MTKDKAESLMNDSEEIGRYCDTHVYFKDQFLMPRGGYIISDHDRRNTRYCVMQMATFGTIR
jgi:hypothetical protein